MILRFRQTVRAILQTVGNILSKLYAKFLLIAVVQKKHCSALCGPRIYVANHPNTLDPFYLLGILQERVVILITEHVFHIPVVGKLVRRAGHIEVGSNGNAVYAEAKEALCQGKSLLIFSEGEISYHPGSLRKFHTGAVRLSLETGVPIVPIGIHVDPTKIWKRKTNIKQASVVFTWYRYGWYTVVFGKPYMPSGEVENREHVRAVTRVLRQQVMFAIGEARVISMEDARQNKRHVKRSFYSALRGVYRIACFFGFMFFKLNELVMRALS